MKRILFMMLALCILSTTTACQKAHSFGPDTDNLWGETATPLPTPQVTAAPTPEVTESVSPTPQIENVTDMTLTLNFDFGERIGTYTGEMVNGLPEGYGSYSSSNPETGTTWVYEGEWVAGHFNGQGTSTFDDGFSATGTYANDYLNGEGAESSGGALRYQGSYLDGTYHGQGTLYNYCDEIIFSGMFNYGYIQESADARSARVSAFKDSCYEPTYDELMNDAQNALSTHAYFSGTVLQVYEYEQDEQYYCDFLLYYQGINDIEHIVSVGYRLTEGEPLVAEDQTVSVWGTPVYTYSYTSVENDYITTPWVEAWSVE